MQCNFNVVDFCMRFEGGEIRDQEEVITGFQVLINTGLAWQLQGTYGRIAQKLIEEGYCTEEVE